MSVRPQHWYVSGALLALAGVALWWLKSSRPNENIPPTNVLNSVPKITENRPAKVTLRRDADFWPQQPWPIPLKRRTLMPNREVPEGIREDQELVWLVQFGGPVDSAEILSLKQAGIEILMPTVACAFHARATLRALKTASIDFVPKILGWCQIEPADRFTGPLALRLKEEKLPTKLRLELYPGVSPDSMLKKLTAIGATIVEADPSATAQMKWVIRGIEISVPAQPEIYEKLALLPGVYALDVARPTKRVCNEEAAAASNITVLQAAPHNLDGSGVNVLVRDQAQIFNHPDYTSRLVLGPDVAAETPVQHATHVAGTIGGTGLADVSALAAGMARNCNLVSFDLLGDDVAEPLQAKQNFGALLSCHAYGFITGWDNGVFNNNQFTFGVYSTFASNWDSIVLSDGLIMIKAVGNDRNDSGPGFPHDGTLAADGEYYDTCDASSTGKNQLIVGAAIDAAQAGTPSSATMVLPSSSSGPTDDGRLKPEIIANGDNVNSTNNSTTVGSEYVRLSGSSMACAVATGATALFLQRYRQTYGSNVTFSPHFLRAMYAQTATDMGRPGPDYLHGFGMLDLSAAIALFEQDNASGKQIVNSNISAAVPERFYSITSDGVTPIKATLCWTDVPGDTLAAKALVNDLDLRLVNVSDQGVTFPFSLDPTHPEAPAVNALNTVDTIEQLLVNPPAAGAYLIAVRGGVISSSTNFTLVSNQIMTEVAPPVAVISPSSTAGQPPFTVTFDGTPSYDSDGAIVRYIWNFGDGTATEGPLVQHTYGVGSFTATLKVIDSQGASASTTVVIAVANQAPTAVLNVSPVVGAAPLDCSFSAVGSNDPDGQILDYSWDFGDGTTAKGIQVSHQYAAPGLYFAKLTVTDNGNASDSRTVTLLAGETLTVKSSTFGLNFVTKGRDKFTFSTKTLPVALDLQTAGLTGTVEVGTFNMPFTLDDKGRFKMAPLSVNLKPSRQQLKVTFSATNLVDSLSNTGATSRDVKGVIVKIPVAFSLSTGQVFGAPTLQYSYTAKQGRSGRGKLYVP